MPPSQRSWKDVLRRATKTLPHSPYRSFGISCSCNRTFSRYESLRMRLPSLKGLSSPRTEEKPERHQIERQRDEVERTQSRPHVEIFEHSADESTEQVARQCGAGRFHLGERLGKNQRGNE